MASRSAGRTEANVQSDLHLLLLAAPLNLDDAELDNIVLEQQAGGQRRIDVEVGTTVFEVKRDLRIGNVLAEATSQLEGYVRSRSATMGQRYVGVLTDGCDWHLYRLEAGHLSLTSSLRVDAAEPDVEAVVVWLEAVLGTGQALTPSPLEVQRRLGSGSPAFSLDMAELRELYDVARLDPEVALKRQLWSRLLYAALGTSFTDDDELFVAHTYLVVVAELVAHAVVEIDLTDPSIAPSSLLAGERFSQSGIGGVVEADFFDWPVSAPGGDSFVRTLARRIARFDWSAVAHDVLKTLYESVIDDVTRHRLGEYYTPDWIAERIVAEVVDSPLDQRVLDPACGSGTFVFWAIRRYLEAADASGASNADAIEGAVTHVAGIDLHPVAVTLARVTYLMAIGSKRLQDRRSFVVPIYLGDSIQLSEDTSILDAGGITIPTTADDQELFAQQIHFPGDIVQDAAAFDQLVTEMADRARSRSSRRAKLPIAVMTRAGVSPAHRDAVEKAYQILCSLHDARRDHIWGYYIRNLARPVWLSLSANRADRLVGNPPWLRFNAMSERMQANFRRLSTARGLWAGGAVATSQDLASLFAVRSIELYLKPQGRFGFVMPAATLSRQHYAGFRRGHWNAPTAQTCVAFGQPWELSPINPQPFPVPSCVVFGERTGEASIVAMGEVAEWWSGEVDHHLKWAEVEPLVTRSTGAIAVDTGGSRGFYGDLMRQGSNLVPRVLFFVEEQQSPAMGLAADTVRVKSRRSNDEREPWRSLPALDAVVEAQFIFDVHFGATLMPFRLLAPERAVIPVLNGHVIAENSLLLEEFPAMQSWATESERVWNANKSRTTRLSLAGQANFQMKLNNQFPIAPVRVIYSGRGGRVAAAVCTDGQSVVDHALYWAPVGSVAEGRYLTAFLNSDVLHNRTVDYYSRGLLGPRNIHKAAFGVPIPVFDAADSDHLALTVLAEECERALAGLALGASATSSNRKSCRDELTNSGVMAELNDEVSGLIPPPPG